MTGSDFSYDVVAKAPDAVQHELCRLWNDNLSLGVSADEKFDWLFNRAPDPADVVFVLKAINRNGDEQIVGTNGLAVRRFLVAGQSMRAAVSSDLVVDQQHRGFLPALKLVRAWRDHAIDAFDLAYGFPNDKAKGVLLRAGFRLLGKTTRYVLVLRHADYASRLRERGTVPALIRHALSMPWVARLGARVLDPVRLTLYLPAAARASTRFRLVWREDPDPRIDTLFEQASREYGVVGVRSRKFLAWRSPGARFAGVERRSDSALVAYAVVERDPATGAAHLRDLFGYPEAFGTTLDLLIPSLALAGAKSVSIRFLGAPKFASVLARRRFESRPGERTVVVEAGTRFPNFSGLITDSERWHLFDVDEDA